MYSGISSVIKVAAAFDSVYQTGSHTKAAELLDLTQPAVSLQIRSLEENLGVKLFKSEARRLIPTNNGKLLHNVMQQSLGNIKQCVDYIRESSSSEIFTIRTYPSIARFLLSDKIALSDFACKNQVRILAGSNNKSILDDPADLWFVHTCEDIVGRDCIQISSERACPVASPEFLKSRQNLTAEQIIDSSVLIDFLDPENDWVAWRDFLSPESFAKSTFIYVDSYNAAIDLAISGVGIALGWSRLTEKLIEKNNLIMVGNKSIDSGGSYRIVCNSYTSNSSALMQLVDIFTA